MAAAKIINLYFNWMCNKIFDSVHERGKSYERLFKYLHNTNFRYIIPLDENRWTDGVKLRCRFIDELSLPENDIEYLNGPCSVMEMMVALAIRCEETIMDNPEKGNRTDQWFWIMINNLGLRFMTDDNFYPEVVEEKLNIFLNREYDRDGEGGLFFVEDSLEDMRYVEIWYQMQKCLNNIDED